MNDDKDKKIEQLEMENARLTQHIIEQAHWMTQLAKLLGTSAPAGDVIVARERALLATRRDLDNARRWHENETRSAMKVLQEVIDPAGTLDDHCRAVVKLVKSLKDKEPHPAPTNRGPRSTHVMAIEGTTIRLSSILVRGSLAKNHGEAHSLINGGAISVNGIRATHDVLLEVGAHDVIVGSSTRDPVRFVLVEDDEADVCSVCFALVKKGHLNQHNAAHTYK